jgi:hypothetical protein
MGGGTVMESTVVRNTHGGVLYAGVRGASTIALSVQFDSLSRSLYLYT